jgi:hypothetical protein
MTTSDKLKNKKIIINIVALILIFFFSFHFYPKINVYNKFDYKGIKTDPQFIIIIDNNTKSYSNTEILFKQDPESLMGKKTQFLKEYMKYLESKPNIIADAPCPNELMENNLRNVQIYFDDNMYLDENYKKFNVRFNFFKFSKNSDNLEINKCFDYIFKENLNKYYLIYLEGIIRILNEQHNLKKQLFFFDDLNSLNLLEKNLITVSNLIDDIEAGKIAFVKFYEKEIEAIYKNGKNVHTYTRNVDQSFITTKLISKNVLYVVQPYNSSDLIKNTINESFLREKIIHENLISIVKRSNFFIDPNVTYVFEKQKDKNSSKIIVFTISLLIIVSINIGYKILNRKQISKFVNKFMNN